MSEKMIRKTAVMEVIKAHMDGEDKNTKAVLSDVMESVNELETLEQEPTSEMVHVETLRQVMWERDIAIGQLKELGYSFGQKIEPCDDAISRNDMMDAIGHGTTYTSEELQRIIQNLPPVNPKPCEDVVSREAVIELIERGVGNKNVTIDGFTFGKSLMLYHVKQLPSVTQKSETVTEFADRCRECGKMRKGHWIYDETLENWRCSKCNETPKTMGYVGTADFMAEHFKFCNHCGAKMESEE